MAKTTLVDPLLFGLGLSPSAAGQGPGSGGGGGNQGGGIGGGGGSPGGGTPGGGGGGGGRPGETTAGNNLSFPAIFPATAPTLRGADNFYTFTTPTYLRGDTSFVYFAQGVDGNEWQAGNIAFGDSDFNFDFDTDEDGVNDAIAVDYVNIGDALESAPIQQGRNVRLELTLFEQIADVTGTPDDPADDTLSGFAMTLLGGSKGKGKPGTTGPTESQGARYPYANPWTTLTDGTVSDVTDDQGITYDSAYASVYAANASSTGEGETVDSYMTLVVQKVEGLTPQYIGQGETDFITGLGWDGTQWVDTDSSDLITVGNNLSTTAFGPELTISGTYNVGASGSPWQFTADGTYLITFAMKDGTPVVFDANTQVQNDDPLVSGFQPTPLTAGRYTQVVADNTFGVTAGAGGGFDPADTHNGLLAMLVGVPSQLPTGGGETGLAAQM